MGRAGSVGVGGFGRRVVGVRGFLKPGVQGSSSLLCREGMPAGAVQTEHIKANKIAAALKKGKESKIMQNVKT